MKTGFVDSRCRAYPWVDDINILLQTLSPDKEPITQEYLRHLVERGNLFVVIDFVRNEKHIVGMGYLSISYPGSGTTAKIDDVVVLKPHRGHKLGELISKALVEEARHQKARRIELRNNLQNPDRAAARHIYEKLGFKPDENYMCYYFETEEKAVQPDIEMLGNEKE